jgi:hypothetical protein
LTSAAPGPHDPRLRPVARFLGPTEVAGGPFSLLGVSPQACTDELVLSALDRQIERLNRHPECDTPEADEVRLALHAAAAQLLDPVVRRHLVNRWSGGRTPVRAAAPVVQRPVAAATPGRSIDAQRLLEADAILTLGLFGGWNQRSLRRLVTLAHRRGLNNRQVAQTLRNLSKRRGRTRPAQPEAPSASPAAGPAGSRPGRGRTPTTRLQTVHEAQVVVHSTPKAETDPAQRLLRNAIIFGFLGLIGLTAAVTGIIVATSRTSPPPAPSVPPVAANTPAPVPALEVESTPEPVKPAKPLPPPPDPADLVAIPRDIAACTEALAIDPDAAATRFEQAVGKLAAHWAIIPKDRLVSSHDAIVEYLYRCAGNPESSVRAIGAIGRFSGPLGAGDVGAADVAPASWSTGMLTRLGRERDLSATAKNSIDSSLAAIMGPSRSTLEQSFEAGVGAALSAWPVRLTPTGPAAKSEPLSLDAWKVWIQCVDALAGQDTTARLRYLLSGLEVLLVQGPEPNENKSVGAVIAEVTSRVTWRPEDDSRRWLLRWFGDGRVSTPDLNAITSALATRASAAGVDLTMVLSTSASENTRAQMRDRYATVWGVQESLARDEMISDWAKIAREGINASFTSLSEADDFAAAAFLARLNDAAWWQWRGDNAEAVRLISDVRAPIDVAMSLPSRDKLEEEQKALSDGAWAERYLAARNAAKLKRELIEQVMAIQAIGSTDAEVLTGEAFTGSPQDVRSAAAEAVKKFTDSASMLGAMLERLPKVPRTAASADLVAFLAAKPLPGFRDPDWPVAARRAIVERLLEAMAAQSPRGRIDRLAALVAGSYRSMAAPSPIPPDQRAVRIQPAAAQSAAEVWRKWRSAADTLVPSSPPPIPVDQLERRRLGRRSQARGMVQEFAAEQTSLAEVMSYVVSCERPEKVEQIKLILTNMASDRRHAKSVLEQIKITERSISQLWLIRMQQELES